MPSPGGLLTWTDYVQAASWAGAVITAAVGVYKFGQDNRKGREQREAEIVARQEANNVADRELEWRRAGAAQTSIEKMEEDRLAADAMLMLDWDGREYSDGEQKWILRKSEVIAALRVEGERFTDAEVYVRDAFDHLFWHFERIQHQIDVGLIKPEHVRFPLGYLVAVMNEDGEAFRAFLRAYGYAGALRLIELIEQLGLPVIKPQYERLFLDRTSPLTGSGAPGAM